MLRGDDSRESSLAGSGYDEVPCVLMPCIRKSDKPLHINKVIIISGSCPVLSAENTTPQLMNIVLIRRVDLNKD